MSQRSKVDCRKRKEWSFVFPSFFFTATWAEAANIRRQLNDIGVPYVIDTYDSEVAFLFPDIPTRAYGQIRKMFGKDAQRFT